MKSANLQIEVFKSIVNQERCIGYEDLGDRVALTRDGMTAFAIPKSQCFIDLSKMRQLSVLKDLFSVSENDKEVRLTRIEVNFGDDKGHLVKLKGDGFSVYCRKSWYNKYSTGQPVYCSVTPNGQITAIKFFDSIHKEVEAIVLPCRVNEEALEK